MSVSHTLALYQNSQAKTINIYCGLPQRLFFDKNSVPQGEGIPLERRYFIAINLSSQLLFLITSTGDKLSGGINIDDLEVLERL